MTSNREFASSDLVGDDRATEDDEDDDDESYWETQLTELLAIANREADPLDPFLLEAYGADSLHTPRSLLPVLASPSHLSRASFLPASRKRPLLQVSRSSPRNEVAPGIGSCDKSVENLGEPMWIAQALLELDSIVKDGTNTPNRRKEASCRCSKSKCLKLYCSCYSAGLACTPYCSCVGCENTKANGIATHPRNCNCAGCQTVKIETSLKVSQGVPSESQTCSCKSSRCLKLYCGCFQSGSFCNLKCRCLDCLNTPTENAENGAREAAIVDCLRRRSDAFDARMKGISDICFCKTNR